MPATRTHAFSRCWLGGAALLTALLALGACSGPGGASATATATPNAQTILQKVKAGNYKDGAFNISLSGTVSGTAFTGTGTGKFTTSPSRASLTLMAPISGQNVAIDIITDGSTNTAYIKVPLLSPKWSKASSASAGIGAGSVGSFNLQNAKLLGTEQLNGVTVYHLQGQDASSVGATDDLYVRQDNYQPVRYTIKSATTSATIDFTSFNTGVTIALPPPDQVQ
jgi:Zn-dependent alcohol dehydrogenase